MTGLVLLGVGSWGALRWFEGRPFAPDTTLDAQRDERRVTCAFLCHRSGLGGKLSFRPPTHRVNNAYHIKQIEYNAYCMPTALVYQEIRV